MGILNNRKGLCVWHDIRKDLYLITLAEQALWSTPSAIRFNTDISSLKFKHSNEFLDEHMPLFRLQMDSYLTIVEQELSVKQEMIDLAVTDIKIARLMLTTIENKNAEFFDGHGNETVITATEVFINLYKLRLIERFARIDAEIDKLLSENTEFLNEISRHKRGPLVYGMSDVEFSKVINKLFVYSSDFKYDKDASYLILQYDDDSLEAVFNIYDLESSVLTTLQGVINQNVKANKERALIDWSTNAFKKTFEFLSSKQNSQLSPTSGSKWGDYLKNFDATHPKRIPTLELLFHTEYHFQQDEYAVKLIDHFNAKRDELNVLDKASYSLAMFRGNVRVKNRSVMIPYSMHTYDLRIWQNIGYVISIDFVEAIAQQELALWEVFSILYFHYNLQIGIERNFIGAKTMQIFLDAGGVLPHYTNPYSTSGWSDLFYEDNLDKWLK